MKLTFRQKKFIYKLKKRFRRETVLNPREAKAIEIISALIRIENADLSIAPKTGNRYITQEDMQIHVILAPDNVIIANHKYYYDIDLGKDASEILCSKFDKILDSRRRMAERAMLSNMLTSLSELAVRIQSYQSDSEK